jgi:hypothetical protein
MTGVEAVSNGVKAFREPVAKTAQVTLTIIIAILAVLLLAAVAGRGWLCRIIAQNGYLPYAFSIRGRRHMVVNGIGAVATGITVCVVLVAIHRHFQSVAEEIKEPEPLSTEAIYEPLVVVPIDRWNKISQRGLRFALNVSKEVKAVHVQYDENKDELAA